MPNFRTVTFNSRVQSGEWRGQMGKLLLQAGVLRSGAHTAGRIEPALGNAAISIPRLSRCGRWQALTLTCCGLWARRHACRQRQHQRRRRARETAGARPQSAPVTCHTHAAHRTPNGDSSCESLVGSTLQLEHDLGCSGRPTTLYYNMVWAPECIAIVFRNPLHSLTQLTHSWQAW